MNNTEILKKRIRIWNKVPGPRVGDYLRVGDKYTRFTFDWGKELQTGGSENGSYYFGEGGMSYSGVLDPGIVLVDIEETAETREGYVWFFNNDEPRKDNAVYFKINCRVFTVKPGANFSGLWDINDDN